MGNTIQIKHRSKINIYTVKISVFIFYISTFVELVCGMVICNINLNDIITMVVWAICISLGGLFLTHRHITCNRIFVLKNRIYCKLEKVSYSLFVLGNLFISQLFLYPNTIDFFHVVFLSLMIAPSLYNNYLLNTLNTNTGDGSLC